MTTPQGAPDALSPVKRALLEIRDLRARLSAVDASRREPIAVVGLGCRLPGGIEDGSSLWRALVAGRDGIRDVPPSRWDAAAWFDPDPDRPGKMWTRAGGFLDDVDLFDAALFGIAPREAATMDPQQRIFLEVAWAALEDAGISPDRLDGSATGVFAGVANADYLRLLFSDRPGIDAYAGSGGSPSLVAGRLSYLLGLTGPSLVVDTACSSSLVAVHLAVQSLRSGECDLALAGGVNVILGPEAHIAFTKARMMAPDGRCKTFDAAADGYGRGEGAGVVVLRRLTDAVTAGDRILAVIRGSAVNQDGRSGGLTAPNGTAQQAVVRSALRAAALQPVDIDYVEAHGTGTSLGDPIELHALGAVLGEGRPAARPLLVGSCKTNFGHLEAAAGIVGLLKTVLSVQHGQVLPHLHFVTPNPLVEWSRLPIRIPTTAGAWPSRDAPRRAGVSAFGFSGTNAHVVIEEAPSDATPRPTTERPRHVLVLSAPVETGLRELAARYATHLDETVDAMTDLCATASTGRAHFSRRLAVTGTTAADLRSGLLAYLSGASAPNLACSDPARPQRPVVAFAFTGQGSQYVGMARRLSATSPVFRRALDECAALLDPLVPMPLADLLQESEAARAALATTECAQPTLVALGYALSAMWRHWGIEPAVVFGHSVGEITAAIVAGALSLRDGLTLVATRGRLMQRLQGGGMMAAFGPRDRVEALVASTGVDIAAINGPEHVVVSGALPALADAAGVLEAHGVRTKSLAVSHAFHSRLMDPALDAFEQAIGTLSFEEPRITLISNVTGEAFGSGEAPTADYWRRHLRQPVAFDAALGSAVGLGVTHLLELGPRPVLLGIAAQTLPDAPFRLMPSLRVGEDDWAVVLDSLARLYADGADVQWPHYEEDASHRRVALPLYPFQRRRHWLGQPSVATTEEAVDPYRRWHAVSTTLRQESLRGPLDVNLADYPARWASLERLTNAHAVGVLVRGGVFTTAGDAATSAQVCERLGARPLYRHLVERWLSRLADSGVLARHGDIFTAVSELTAPNMLPFWDEASQRLADNQPLLAYVRHCGSLLDDVLLGRVSPLETLFPKGSFALAEGLYERSSTLRYANGLLAAAAAAVAASHPRSRLRVLEAGAGTGSSTAAILPVLPPDRCEYWHTDITGAFASRARARFGAYAFVQYGELDLERAPSEQGHATGSFDVVIAANAVHATRDIRAALGHLRALLAPGGVLLLLETTAHLAWLDMTIGLFDGWQHFADDLRTDQPLLAPERWVEVLRDAGFTEAEAFPGPGTIGATLGLHVIAAIAPLGAEQANLAESSAFEAAPPVGASVPLPPPATGVAERVRTSLPGERLDLLETFVRTEVMSTLRLAADDAPGPHDRLMDLGFDSLMAVQFRNRLEAALGVGSLPATILFDYPTIESLARFLLDRMMASPPATDTPSPATNTPSSLVASSDERTYDEDIIAGMSDADIERVLLARLAGEALRDGDPWPSH